MNIEQEVREMLNAKVRSAPGMEEPPQPVLRRARTRRVMNGVALTMIVGLLATGSVLGVRSLGTSGTIEPTTRTGVVPWTSATAAPLVGEPEPPACRAEDLRLTAAAHFRADLELEAIGAPCFLKSYSVRVLGSNGRPLPILSVAVDVAARIAPGDKTALLGEWTPCAPSEALTFQLHLQSGGMLAARSAPNRGEGVCAAGTSPTSLRFNGAIAPPTERALAWLRILDNLRAKISGVPASARAGDTLNFKVTLQNVSDRRIILEPCPTYSELIVLGNDGPEQKRYTLNCEGAGSVIEPRESVVFDMRYSIPYDIATGEWSLIWTLDVPPGIGSDVQAATHQITISAA